MAKFFIHSGIVSAVDLGFHLREHAGGPLAYKPGGLRALTVQNAARDEVDVEYGVTGGGERFHPLSKYLPGYELRSLVAVVGDLKEPPNWPDWRARRVFARKRRLGDVESVVLRPAITLPNGGSATVTDILQILTESFDGWKSHSTPKSSPMHGEDIYVEAPGSFQLYAENSQGEFDRVALGPKEITTFDEFELRLDVTPEDPATGYPPG